MVGTEKKKAKTIELSEEYQKNQSEIEKKFYNEYKAIRLHIFENMRKNNPTVNENTIIEKVQKLLDRFLFICFCEDKGLLPNNIFHKTLEKGKNFGDVFEVFKMLCNWINLGNPRKNISHFNGGLFKNDDILESLYVDNEVFEEMKKISEYDFDSELNENILGHIFEQSISDIEDLKKELNGEEFDKKKGKRKKDGIFYTPKYITKYIVENSIKNWLDDKRKELGEDKLPELTEKDFEIKYSSKKSDERIYSKNYKKHIEFWTKYREDVKNIKIVDPACGSGAFLITAFEYLLNYNNYLNDKIFDLTGTKDLFSDTTREILQNNIFGVDLNKESVEITKLSLWLKTANKNKTLATLENNIKCGNSLIDDAGITGELAFNWEKEFPQVFKDGGFDVVVGNPPYVLCQPSNTEEKLLKFYNNFEVANYKIDLYHLFFEKGIKILNSKGYLGFITPNTYLTNKYTVNLRKLILEKTSINTIIKYNEIVFTEAGVDVVTILLSNFKIKNNKINILSSKNKTLTVIDKKEQEIWENDELKVFNLNKELSIKLENTILLNKIYSVTFGLQTKDKSKYVSETKSPEWEECYTGKNISRYFLSKANLYFYNNPIEVKAGGSWNMKLHKSKKIVVRQVGNPEPVFAYDDKKIPSLNTMYNIVNIDKNFDDFYILSILNSKLMKKYWLSKYNDNKDLFPKIKGYQLKELPIKKISLEAQQPFIEKADKMLFLNKNLQELSQKFQRMIMRELGLEKISTKLQNWYLLNFDEFIKELSKVKVKLSLSQKADWEDYFIAEKSKAETLNNEITKTDKEIDGMVYELYGLSEEEIKIIEGEK